MNWTRLAVVATVALGVVASAFLALRPEDRPAGLPARDSPAPPEVVASPGATPARPPPPSLPTPSPAPPPSARPPDGASTTVRQQAEAEVARIRDRLVAGCAADLRDTRSPLSFRVRLVFDATGREVIRSVTADQRSPQPIANCLTRVAAGTLRVPPPGRTVTVIVPLTIP
jgi:hypothetical protein